MHVQTIVTKQHAATSLGEMQCDHNYSHTPHSYALKDNIPLAGYIIRCTWL